jgi:hypothetical protein
MQRVISQLAVGVFAMAMLISGLPAVAETVMVFSREIGEDANRDYVTALESGIMDVFFETGHIVLSAREGSLRSPIVEADPALTAAKAQGAELVVDLRFEIANAEEPSLPGSVAFRILRVANATVLATGIWKPEDLREPVGESDLDLVIRLGRELGQEAVALWN